MCCICYPHLLLTEHSAAVNVLFKRIWTTLNSRGFTDCHRCFKFILYKAGERFTSTVCVRSLPQEWNLPNRNHQKIFSRSSAIMIGKYSKERCHNDAKKSFFHKQPVKTLEYLYSNVLSTTMVEKRKKPFTRLPWVVRHKDIQRSLESGKEKK